MSTSDLLLNIETTPSSNNIPPTGAAPTNTVDQSTASAAVGAATQPANVAGSAVVVAPPPSGGTSTTAAGAAEPAATILVVGAPTSVVVQVPQPQPSTSSTSSSSSSSSSSTSPSSLILTPPLGAAVSAPTPPPVVETQPAPASQLHYEFMQPLMAQGSSSSSSSGGGSSAVATAAVVEQQVADFMKRRFDMMREFGGCGGPAGDAKLLDYYNKRSRTGKASSHQTMSSGAAGATASHQQQHGKPGSWDDPLTLKQKLEQRLNGILCCAVCIDLPKSSVYQCPNGHLMCAGCFTHVLADARLRDETPTCPNCRIQISKESCSRNLAVEKAVCELPGECRFCQRELPRSMLEKHMTEVCEERIVPCRFSNIGCPWNGPFHEADYHANICIHPKKSAREVLDHLEEQEHQKREQRKVYETLFALLSYEKISFQDVQFRPYRTDEYIHKLFYETSRFPAFNLQWVVKARVNGDQRDPTQSCDRHLSFQLCLKSKPANTMTIHYMLLKGPYGETKVLPMIYKFDFTETQTESPYNVVNLATVSDSNRLLAARMINFRLIMFQASK